MSLEKKYYSMTQERTKNIVNFKLDVEKELEDILVTFKDFTDGMRMLLLMERKKDGGHNKEERRVFETYTTFNSESFKEKLRNLLYMKHLFDKNLRIYCSANPRDLNKVVRHIEEGLLESHYTDQFNRDNIKRKVCGGQRHYIMQPQNALSKLFLLDIDNEDGKDAMGDALIKINDLGLEEVLRYKTKNGWHIVVKPFNPALWGNPEQVKKDPLLLLSY